jgi:tetratricopeptide (TPR) repeat protein
MAAYQKDVGLYQEALRYLYQAELFDKLYRRTSMMTQYHIGWNLQLLGRNTEAVQVLTAAIPSQPDYASVYYRRGLAYEGLADRSAAKADFEKVAELVTKSSQGFDTNGAVEQAIAKKLSEYGIQITIPKN